MKFKLLLLTFILSPLPAMAFFCPTNFSQIDFGMTPDQVIAQCGQPDVNETKEVTPEGPQEWNYYIPHRVANPNMQPALGTIKTEITFDAEGKVVNISSGDQGMGISSSNICGTTISIGSTREQVKAACGEPPTVNKELSALEDAPKKQVTTFTYNSAPPVKLIFEDGKLTQKQ